jgi:hypothetical protein
VCSGRRAGATSPLASRRRFSKYETPPTSNAVDEEAGRAADMMDVATPNTTAKVGRSATFARVRSEPRLNRLDYACAASVATK